MPSSVHLRAASAKRSIGRSTAASWVVKGAGRAEPKTYDIGNAFLRDYVLPYEIASQVLLVELIGAVVVSRKEIQG